MEASTKTATANAVLVRHQNSDHLLEVEVSRQSEGSLGARLAQNLQLLTKKIHPAPVSEVKRGDCRRSLLSVRILSEHGVRSMSTPCEDRQAI